MQTQTALIESMRARLSKLVPDMEIAAKAELIAEINELKKEKNAVILGHNYMEPALFHFAADLTGDSLELCRLASQTEHDIIVFCGVRFMAESAKIINPSKKVLIPSAQAGCSLAASITGEDVRKIKAQYPGVPVVTYVNCYAEVKAETDICCTSSNAVQVVNSLDSDTVIFLPDEYLARNVARETNKNIIFPGKESRDGLSNTMIAWNGKCEVHEKFTVEDITNVRRQFPDVIVLAHPECPPDVVEAADFSGSTSAIVKYVRENDAPQYLILTECSMGDNIIAENPTKEVLRLCSVRCPHMNEITLEQTRDALKFERYEVDVDLEIREKAKKSIDRMLAITA